MTRKWDSIVRGIFSLVLIFFAASQALAYGSRANIGNIKESARESGPDFTLKDLQGRKFTLSETKGKPVLLIFSTTWCPYCIEEIPHLKTIYNLYTPKGLVMLQVDVKEPRDKVLHFAEKHKLPYRVVLDETTDVAQSYGVQGVPTLVLLDQEGQIVCRQCSSVELLLDKLFMKK